MGLACLYCLFLSVLMDPAASDLFEDLNRCCDSDESRGASDSSSHDPSEWSVDSSGNEFGATHSVLLRSDGTAVACGDNRLGQCNIPDLVEGVIYTHVDTGVAHTVLLASDGTAVACGSNEVVGGGRSCIVSWCHLHRSCHRMLPHCFVEE